MATPALNMEVMAPITSTGKRLHDQANKYSRDLYKQKMRDIKQLGKDLPVTIINMNPFPLKINGGVLFPEEIPACPVGKPYARFVLREIKWQSKDNGCDAQNMMQMEPIPYVPLVLATEYVREYMQSDYAFGGVMCFVGDEDPATFGKDKVVKVPEISYDNGEMFVEVQSRNFRDTMNLIRSKRNASTMRALQSANSWYENDDQRQNVNDTHREMARLAVVEGLIPELPRWVMQANTLTSKQPDPCPSCMAVPKAGAIVCTNCNFYFDVLAAYKLARIPYGSVDMDRLSADEWKVANALKAQRDKDRGVRPQ